jgi:hypothetical protein
MWALKKIPKVDYNLLIVKSSINKNNKLLKISLVSILAFSILSFNFSLQDAFAQLPGEDSDDDGFPDDFDNCPSVSNEEQEDTDGDGRGDACQDSDNDGITDEVDQCVNQPETMNGFEDTDGCPDTIPDSDDDGITDDVDQCDNQAETMNGFEDTDGCPDSLPAPDADDDGFPDNFDNCPFLPNPEQEDTDENGIGDACQDAVDLLIDANFDAGETIEVMLPEDPEIGIFSLSLTLPDDEGGDVVIQTTDAGDTPGNFSILGFVIDFTAPCSNLCDISFTFTQAALDEAGITLDQVTIFHDSNENGSFEENEAIETTISGDDPFTATASASFTSKFSVGGIKALALGALAQGGGSSGGNSPPLFGKSSFAIITDGKEGFGGILNDENATTFEETKTFKVGQKAILRFDYIEGGGIGKIEHIGLYTNIREGQKKQDSDVFIYYEPLKSPQVSVHDPNGKLSEVNFEILQKDATKFVLKYDLTFAQTMARSDFVLEGWNIQKWSTMTKIPNAIEVISSGIVKEEQSEPVVETFVEDITNDQVIPVWVKTNAKWWSDDEIDSKNFISGIEYLVNEGIIAVSLSDTTKDASISEIQPWIKNAAGWWANDMISNDEFLAAIEWLISNDIIQIV